MTAITHQKYEIKREIYLLLKEYTDALNAEERRGFALAMAEMLMAKMPLSELKDWRNRLEDKRPSWTGGQAA